MEVLEKMKEAFKVKAAKVTSAVLVAAMTFALIPKFIGNDVVLAAAGDKNDSNTSLGISAIGNPTSTGTSSDWAGSYVYFGTYNGNPIKFRILKYDSTVHTAEKALFLDSDAILETMEFGSTNAWASSEVKRWLNEDFFTSNNFTDREMAAVPNTNVESEHDLTTATVSNWSVGAYGKYVPLSGEKVFLLDAEEASNSAYGYDITDTSCASRKKIGGPYDYWWLRSADAGDASYAGYVDDDGLLSSLSVDNPYIGVAPALNINQESIIFTTAVENETNAYKLTLSDSNLIIAVPDGKQTTIEGTTVTVPYEITGTDAGTATRASVLILDKEKDDIIYYDDLNKISGTFSTSSSGTFDIPAGYDLDGWGSEYFVYILAEDINGEKKTDYASAFVELSAPKYTVAVNVMTYDTDGVTFLTATPEIGGSASVDKETASKGDVVTVTVTPNSGYTLKRIEWGNGAADGTDITSTKSFTVGDFKPVVDVYFQKEAPATYTVTVNSGSSDVTTATQGATVTLTAGAAPTGKEFDKWVVDSGTITLADATSATTTFTMPAENVEVTATYKDVPATTYNVTVNSGSADTTTAAQGATITLTAGAAPTGKEFDKWVVDSGTITLADAASATTTFTMPAENVEVTATYKDIPVTTFTVTFETNGGTAVAAQTVTDGSKAVKPADPTKDGFTFDGWYQDATLTVAFSFDTAITANTTLYAKWTEIVTPGTISYTVVSGANGTWTEGDIVITVKRSEDDEHCIDYFSGVKIDDTELVSGTDYTAVAGSTVVTIKGSTLEKLSKGGHTITVIFNDGTAVTSVTLKEKETVTTTAVPSTGETASKYIGAAVLCFVAAGTLFGVVLFERKKRKCAE